MLTTLRRAEYAELIVLFFLQGAALAMWLVPLTGVLDAHGFAHLRPWAFATTGVAAFVSPLLFGAMADRHVSPVKVLRWLSFATAVTMALASTAIRVHAGSGLVLVLIQIHALCSAPAWTIGSTIILARLSDTKKEFGPIRAMATLGWIGGCVLVSVIGADRSTLSGFSGSIAWLLVFALTFWLPAMATPKSAEGLTWTQRLGLDAISLLRNRDHRVIFLTTALFTIPLAAFYPYTPPQLRELGLTHTSAWMSLGQVSEVVAMFTLGPLLSHWRLKWIISLGLAIGVLRYVLCATGSTWAVLAGVLVHGGSFTFVFITAQIYLEQRIDSTWRARAQSLLALMNSGLGNMTGYLGVGAWFAACASATGAVRWTLFWIGLSLAAAVVLTVFLAAYRGRGTGLLRKEDEPAAAT